MYKFYIYGVPRGFSIKGDDSSKKELFQNYYNGSQDEVKLVVNRSLNGDVLTYSYLRYKFRDNGGRGGGFLGLSISLKGYYCADIKILFDFFDFLYDKLCDLEIIKKITNDDNCQAKFLIDDFTTLANDKFIYLKQLIDENINDLNFCRIEQTLKPIKDQRSVYCTGYNIIDVNNLYWEALNKYTNIYIYKKIETTIEVLGDNVKYSYLKILSEVDADFSQNVNLATDCDFVSSLHSKLDNTYKNIKKDIGLFPKDRQLNDISKKYKTQIDKYAKLLSKIKGEPDQDEELRRIKKKYEEILHNIEYLQFQKKSNKQFEVAEIREKLEILKSSLNSNSELKNLHVECENKLIELEKQPTPNPLRIVINAIVKPKSIAIIGVLCIVGLLLFLSFPDENLTEEVNNFDKAKCKIEIVEKKNEYNIGDTIELKAYNYSEEDGCQVEFQNRNSYDIIEDGLISDSVKYFRLKLKRVSNSSNLTLAKFCVNGIPIENGTILVPIISEIETAPVTSTQRTPQPPVFDWGNLRVTLTFNGKEIKENGTINAKDINEIELKIDSYDTRYVAIDYPNDIIPVKGPASPPIGTVHFKLRRDSFDLGQIVKIENLYKITPKKRRDIKIINGCDISAPTFYIKF